MYNKGGKMKKYPVKVLGFGDNVVDKYTHIHTMYPGGNCVNFAVYSSMIGVERSAYMGYFGNDSEAEHVIQTLEKIPIEIYKCSQLNGENGCAKVSIENGERIFMGSNLGGIRGKTEFELNRFDLQYIAGVDLVHSGNYSFMERQIPKIQNLGVPVSFDFSDCSTESYKKEMCAVVDYAFLSCGGRSLKEAEEETRALVSYGAKLAVATRGSEPCVAYDGKSFYYQEPKKIENVLDTMGAGDSFITAFLVHYISDKKAGQANVGKALDMASQFAAQICLLEGAFGYGKKYQ